MSPKYPDDFDLITAMQNAKARAEEREDQQNAAAGRVTGRGLSRSALHSDRELRAQQREDREFQTLLDQLLQDPAYAAAYHNTWDRLNDAEQATQSALHNIEREIVELHTALSEMEDKAARLPDGRIIFRDGGTARIFTAKGLDVTNHPDVAAVQWPENAPDWRDYRTAQDRHEELDREHNDVLQYETDVLGTARDRMSDRDNPPSMDELESIQSDIASHMPARAMAQLDTSDSPSIERGSIDAMKVPELPPL
ncbi:MAG: hypothetical protein AAFV59_18265 [Pseudomonadota bacterium]